MSEAANFYLKKIADNTTEANEKLEAIHEALELGSKLGAAEPPPPPDPGKVIPLSYLLHRQQQGGGVGTRKDPVHKPNGDSVGQAILEFVYSQIALNNADTSHYWSLAGWTKDNMRADLRTESPYYPDFNAGPYVTWDYQGIDPEFSQWNDGDEHIVSSVPYEQQGQGWIVDLSEADPDKDLPFEREESVTLTQERSVSMTHTTEIDVGVESTTKIGGELAGVSLEEELKLSFGYKDTEEDAEAKSNSTSKETSTKIAYDCPGAEKTLLTIESQDINSFRPKEWDGAARYGFTLYTPQRDWLARGVGRYLFNGTAPQITAAAPPR